MKYYRCPNCGLSIPDKEDILLKHKTFCKSSYENFSTASVFTESTIDSLSDLLTVDTNKPPRGIMVQKTPEGEIKITYKSSVNLAWPLLIFSFLPAICLFLPKIPLRDMTFLFIISGTATLFFILNLISSKIGKSELTLKNGKGIFFCGIGKYGQKVIFEFNKNSTVSIQLFESSAFAGSRFISKWLTKLRFTFLSALISGMPRRGIIVTTNGEKTTFGGMLPPPVVIQYIAAYLLREISK